MKCIDDEIPFEIPQSWCWVRLGYIFLHCTGKALNANNKKGRLYSYITTSNLYWDRFELSSIKEMYFTDEELEKCTAKKGDLLVCEGGDIGRSAIWNYDYDIRIQNHIHKLRSYHPISTRFFYYVIYLYKGMGNIGGKGIGIQGLSSGVLHNILLPLPSYKEQSNIVSMIEKIMPFTDKYEKSQETLNKLNAEIFDKLKKSVLQEAIQGKLVPQDPNDEPASILLDRIKEEKAKLFKDGKLKKKDLFESVIFKGDDNKYFEKKGNEVVCIDDEIPFEIPDSWEWVRFKNVAIIARGGSPRPIKSYLTENPNGVNWIKIGDTEKGGKYINSVKEKIKPEGVSSSRMVHKGDFLLTNSMSFGRPYITNVDGCIHDGWLVISPFANTFIQDYLFHLLSSAFAYNQFSGKVSGAVVKNLNIDKVLDAIIPLPPLQEQKRIVMALDNVLASIMRN